MLERPFPPNPYALLPETTHFEVSSTSFADGDPLPMKHVYNEWGHKGENISPQLSWSGEPKETTSFVVTCFDPDAPTPSGFWHWVVAGISRDVHELPEGAGSGRGLPTGAFLIRNDTGSKEYAGAAPPQGDRPHRYLFAVHAIGGEPLQIDESVTPAVASFNMIFQTIGRGFMTATYQA